MDPRFIKPGIIAAQAAGTGIFHPTLVHPRTGEPLEAVGVSKRGIILWPIMGAAEEEDIEKDAEDSVEEDEDEEDEKDDDEDEDDEKDPKAKLKALEEEKDRHYSRRKKAEKERDAVKAELETLKAKLAKGKNKADPKKTKDKPAVEDDDDDDDDEKVTLRSDVEKARKEARDLKVQNAFLRVNAVDWVNPSQVMTLLMADDDYEVEFDDNGNVDRKSLAAELKRFAKANRHLVKVKAKSSSEDDDQDDSSGKSSGSSMNGQRKGKAKKEPTREELAKKYSALGMS